MSPPHPLQPLQPVGFRPCSLETALGTLIYHCSEAAPAESDALPLIFFHSLGGGSSSLEWAQVYPALATTHPVIAPDLVGWGQSAHPAHAYRTADYLAMAEAVLTQAVDRPAAVVASSLMAGVVLQLAVRRPDLFAGLFLVSPLGNADFGRSYRPSLPALLAATPGLDQVLYQVGAANALAVTTFLSTFLVADARRVPPAVPQGYLIGTQLPQAADAALASLRGDICFDLSRYVPQLRVPTAFVLGSESRFTPPAVVRRLASLNPQAITQVYDIPQAGVLPHLEQPAVVVGRLVQFLQSLDGERANCA